MNYFNLLTENKVQDFLADLRVHIKYVNSIIILKLGMSF